MRLSETEFLERIKALFAGAQQHHSVFVSAKRAPRSEDAGSEHPLLVRATDGKSDGRSKFSTLVAPSAVAKFQAEYLAIMRTSLAASLKKRDKAKERRVDKALAMSRKRLEENEGKVPITGSKRGAGRRKRMRALHRARRLRAARRTERSAPDRRA